MNRRVFSVWINECALGAFNKGDIRGRFVNAINVEPRIMNDQIPPGLCFGRPQKEEIVKHYLNRINEHVSHFSSVVLRCEKKR